MGGGESRKGTSDVRPKEIVSKRSQPIASGGRRESPLPRPPSTPLDEKGGERLEVEKRRKRKRKEGWFFFGGGGEMVGWEREEGRMGEVTP